MYHGERVALGLLVQLILENRPPDEILGIQRFYAKVGLPVTLKDIRIVDQVERKLREVVKKACEPGRYVHNMPFLITEQSLFDAIRMADALGREFLATTNYEGV